MYHTILLHALQSPKQLERTVYSFGAGSFQAFIMQSQHLPLNEHPIIWLHPWLSPARLERP
eukprot:5039666-Karenia_brevis.AAC.1